MYLDKIQITELQSIFDQKGKAALLSKLGGVKNGNRPTKYFFNFERKNYKKIP